MSYDLGFIDEECVPYQCAEHTPIAGMVHVHPEDLTAVADMRRNRGLSPVGCENCDMRYVADEWMNP